MTGTVSTGDNTFNCGIFTFAIRFS